MGAKHKSISFLESLKVALASLATHKLRTSLTLLGVIIAVTTLIAVVAVIEGMNAYVADRVANLGSNAFVVDRFGFITSFEAWLKAMRRNKILKMADYEALRQNVRLARAVGAQIWGTGDLKYRGQVLYDVSVNGVTANMIDIDITQVEDGRYINPFEVEHSRQSCVIGADVAENLFPSVTPLGKIVKIRGQPFEVVGVAKKIGSTFGFSRDNFVKIPISAHQKLFGSRRSISIWVRALDSEKMEDAMDEVRAILRARHHVRYNDSDDFAMVAASTFNDLWKNLTGTIFLVAVLVTSVFLVVGGIVIMNIMLAVVTERTREIGIRKSMGARRRDILMQFLIESVIMGTTGGGIGVLIAYIGTRIMSSLSPIPSALPIWAVLLALIVSGSVGLFFGIYPANKAAKLDPITALRTE